jgi:hypothetical protein
MTTIQPLTQQDLQRGIQDITKTNPTHQQTQQTIQKHETKSNQTKKPWCRLCYKQDLEQENHRIQHNILHAKQNPHAQFTEKDFKNKTNPEDYYKGFTKTREVTHKDTGTNKNDPHHIHFHIYHCKRGHTQSINMGRVTLTPEKTTTKQ